MDDFDLDKYQAHIQEIIDSGDGDFRPTQAKNIMKLIGLIRQAEKDAARYRWLRDSACTDDLGEFDNAFRQHRDSLLDDLMNA